MDGAASQFKTLLYSIADILQAKQNMKEVMKSFRHKLEQKAQHGLRSEVFRNEDGAIDLASIMVGIIVIGLIGGVIAATVFAVIPWTQDNAAKQQLDSVVAAQSAYKGLSSGVPPATPAGHTANSYADSTKLEEANLLGKGASYCATTTDSGNGYVAFSKAGSGTIWSVSDKNTKPVIHTGTLPSDCTFIKKAFSGGGYVDETPTLTTLTYRCDTDVTGTLPLKTNVTGTETWSDGVTKSYSAAAAPTSRALTAGVEYKVTFDGTYNAFDGYADTAVNNLTKCLTAVNHWGSETGVTDATEAFMTAAKLTDVPKHIPATITSMKSLFSSASIINDPDISEWDTSNVTSMERTFLWAKAFNQPLNNWDTSKVTNMSYTFYAAHKFNQPLNDWNTGNVTNIAQMFGDAFVFNQDLNSWNTSNVTIMSSAFSGATAFNQPLNNWDVSKVTNLGGMFFQATAFNQPLDKWNTGNVTSMSFMFSSASKFNQNINSWNTSNVTNMSNLFNNANAFNQPLNNWNTSKVTDMSQTFSRAYAFNQNISNWDTSSVVNMELMFSSARLFNQPLDNWNVSKVTTMYGMFNDAAVFNQSLNTWNVGNVTIMREMFANTTFNQPLNNWNTVKVTNMRSMFWGNTKMVQNLSMWDQTALTSGTDFAPAATFPIDYKPTKTTLY